MMEFKYVWDQPHVPILGDQWFHVMVLSPLQTAPAITTERFAPIQASGSLHLLENFSHDEEETLAVSCIDMKLLTWAKE